MTGKCQQLVFPPDITSISLRPDVVFWSPTLKFVYIIEVTVLWEESVEEAYKRKKLLYTECVMEIKQRGWKSKNLPCIGRMRRICC